MTPFSSLLIPGIRRDAHSPNLPHCAPPPQMTLKASAFLAPSTLLPRQPWKLCLWPHLQWLPGDPRKGGPGSWTGPHAPCPLLSAASPSSSRPSEPLITLFRHTESSPLGCSYHAALSPQLSSHASSPQSSRDPHLKTDAQSPARHPSLISEQGGQGPQPNWYSSVY